MSTFWKLFLAAFGAACLVTAAVHTSADATPRIYKLFERKKPAVKTPGLEGMKQQSLDRCARSKEKDKCLVKTAHYVAALEARRVCRTNKRAALAKRGEKNKTVINARLASACNDGKAKALAFLTRR